MLPVPYGVGNDESASYHMYHYPEGLESQRDAGFAQGEYGHPGTICVIGAHEMSGSPGPYSFNRVHAASS